MPPKLVIEVYKHNRYRDFFCGNCQLAFKIRKLEEDSENYVPVRCPFCGRNIRIMSGERKRKAKRIDAELLLDEEK